jgi:tryptophan-rich sensory protein
MNNAYSWYSQLKKPKFAPSSWIFGPVWTILYILIAISYGYVGYLFYKGQIPFMVVLPFILNLIFNFAYTPIQFGLKNNYLAAIDILLVLGTMILAFVSIYPYVSWIFYMNIPYLLWVSFATFLQLTVTWMNRKMI